MSTQLNKTQSAIVYLLNELSGRLLKTQLIKLLFLADIEHWKQTGKQLTDLKYVYDNFGPYDREYDNDLELLKNIQAIQTTKIEREDRYYFLIEKKSRTLLKQASENIENIGRAILDEIISQYGKTTLKSLLEIVYAHPLISETTRGSVIDFNQIPALKKMKQDLNNGADW